MDARQWSRASWALAALFASLPLAARVLFGNWDFMSGGGIACLLALAGAYLRIRSRRYRTKPDPASLLDQANRLAMNGQPDRALALLTRTIRQNPKLWQAYQYRGELRLRLGEFSEAAGDFSEAIRLAPGEPHLRVLLDAAIAQSGT